MANSLPDDFWEKERGKLLALLMPALTQAAQAGVSGVSRMGLTFNPELSNHDAAEWAAAYADDLLIALETTNQRVVGEALRQWAETPGATMGDLEKQLAPAFGAARANLIAVTETTRAYSQGNQIAFQEAGIEHWRWNTTRDNLVCPTCSPLHRKVAAIGEPFAVVKGKVITAPPAHPGCRCTISPVVNPQEPLRPRNEIVQTLPIGGKLREARTIRVGKVRVTEPVTWDSSRQIIGRRDVPNLLRDLDKLPADLREAVREVRLTDERNNKLESLRGSVPGYEGLDRIAAATSPSGVVTFYPNSDLLNDPNWPGVGANWREEVGHAVAWRVFGRTAPRDENAWAQAMLADNQSPTGEVNPSQAEDWAAMIAMWLENPVQAEQLYPARMILARAWSGLQ